MLDTLRSAMPTCFAHFSADVICGSYSPSAPAVQRWLDAMSVTMFAAIDIGVEMPPHQSAEPFKSTLTRTSQQFARAGHWKWFQANV